ncbi:MAG TPA: N-acetyltransferase [Bacteroidales bacterium]|nr:MAG: hypothetical protein A2W98_11120 [Bacteroidetes bacterium GWF2_33_38]OFY88148.1 MAG: hypothetical protein A2236_13150 [Bacteroidetes bacterium RIFOXYA2_FULL_33_7]HBF89146.1 N-acetyltransferase [Bacteroidales bacterium]
MKLIEVNDNITKKEFLEVPKILYKDDKNWICPLDVEIDGTFNPKNNSCFNFGEAIRWILKDESGKLIGRIAAFYDNRKKNHCYIPSGNIGFFECINNQEYANMLFDKAQEWLKSKGLEAMDGSTNFGENLFNWGVLVDGFEPQEIGMQYNFPYYKELFENYGFKDYFKQYSYRKVMAEKWPERQYKMAKFIASRPEYTYEHFTFANKNKYINDLVDTYNTVWADFHDDYTPLKFEEINKMFDEIKTFLVEDFVWFVYTNGKPIGMVIVLPDVNQIIKKLKNGKLTLWNKLKFAYLLKYSKTMNRARIVMTGVVPEFQSKGVIAGLFYYLINSLEKHNYKQLELAWTGDYNPNVLGIYDNIGAFLAKTHITYKYIFDKNFEFKRFTNERGHKSRRKTDE